MSRNGSGVWSAPSNSWNPAVSGTTVDPTDWAAFLADLTTAMSASIANDGQTTCTAVIPFAAGISVPAGGVQFPATQSASSDANNLDDYEEGTWTPALKFGGALVGMAGTFAGFYTKIGNRVFWSLEFTLSAKGSSTGNATITGMPFTAANVTGNRSPAAVFVDVTAGLTVPMAYIGPNSSTVALYNFTSNAAASMTDANFTDTTNMFMSGNFRV